MKKDNSCMKKKEKLIRTLLYLSKEDKEALDKLVDLYKKYMFRHISKSKMVGLALHHHLMHQKTNGYVFPLCSHCGWSSEDVRLRKAPSREDKNKLFEILEDPTLS